MTKWRVIDTDKDIKDGSIMGATFAMKVPGGMIIRSVMNGGSQSMVFVPMTQQMVAPNISVTDQWIKENEIDK